MEKQVDSCALAGVPTLSLLLNKILLHRSMHNEPRFIWKYIFSGSHPHTGQRGEPNLGQHFVASAFEEKDNVVVGCLLSLPACETRHLCFTWHRWSCGVPVTAHPDINQHLCFEVCCVSSCAIHANRSPSPFLCLLLSFSLQTFGSI